MAAEIVEAVSQEGAILERLDSFQLLEQGHAAYMRLGIQAVGNRGQRSRRQRHHAMERAQMQVGSVARPRRSLDPPHVVRFLVPLVASKQFVLPLLR